MDFTRDAPELSISPDGYLYFNQSDLLPEFEKIRQLLLQDQSLCLLYFGFANFTSPLSSTLLFWQSFARKFISNICKHFDRDCSKIETVPPPSEEEIQIILTQIPFMQGSEYLSKKQLLKFWSQLEKAFQYELEIFSGTIQNYLNQYNSHWNLVGRIYFHLAENKKSESHPFAFLATYTTSLSDKLSTQHLPLKRALNEYIGEKNLLLALLTPIQKAASISPFVKKMVDSKAIYEAKAWSANEAYQFLKDVPLIEQCGVVIRVPDWWSAKKITRVKASIKIDAQTESKLNANSLFEFNAQLAIGEESLSKEEWATISKGSENLVKIKGQWVEIDREKLNEVLSQWEEIKKATKDGLSLSEAFRLLSGMDQSNLSNSISDWCEIKPGQFLKNILKELNDPKDFPKVKLKNFQGTLRPYQSKGLQWLWTLYNLKLGGCLADDMGLGKTVQVLSLLLAIKEISELGKPHLLIAPASLLGNWKAEAAKFAPTLRIAIAHSSEGDCDFSAADLIITTYAFVHRRKYLKEIKWDLIILDEAQAIKNPSSKQSRSVKELKAETRIALTGTPIENRLSDLWSLFDFINPNLLGTDKEFSSYLKKAGKDQSLPGYSNFISSLRKITQPYILRRLKNDKSIITDLPDKTEIKTYCNLSKAQILHYEETIKELALNLESSKGIHRRGLILSSLMRLKQICNHPAQLQGFGEYNEKASGKMIRLREICEVIAEKQEKVLIFTQFTEVIQPLFNFLKQIFKREGLSLHGKTPIGKRAELVQSFQENQGPPFFILSLKAGGTGLNLTKANHVIHFDRWWNPAVESQATDRAYRIGQENPVIVHQFICQGTIEEKIDALIDSKKNIAKEILEKEGEVSLTELSNEQIMEMVSIDIHKALGEI